MKDDRTAVASAAAALQRFLVRTFIAVARERQAQLAEAMKAAAEQRL